MQRAFVRSLLTIILCVSFAGPAQAIVHAWNTGNGSFAIGTNWSPSGVPSGNSDTATFRRGSAATYSVTFPGDDHFPLPVYSFDKLRVGSNTVTLSDSVPGLLDVPGTVSVTNTTTAPAGRGIVIGEADPDVAIVYSTLAKFSGVAATLGDGPSTVGILHLDGGALTLTGSSSTDDELIIGNQGRGELHVSGGAHLNVNGVNGNIVMSRFYGGGNRGSIDATGAGSQVNVAGDLAVGLNDNAHVGITSGAALNTASATIGVLGSSVFVGGDNATWNNTGSILVASTSGTGAGSNGGSLTVVSGATLSSSGLITVQGPNGNLTGVNSTIVANVQNSGSLSFAPSPTSPYGALQIEGDYSQLGNLIDFPVQDLTHFSRLQVSGNLSLSSPFVKITGFGPYHVGDSFDLLDWGSISISGLPISFELPGLPAALRWTTSQLLVTGVIRVDYRFSADFDADADVDVVDLSLLKGSFGMTVGATHLQGDADGDGDVDGGDFLAWQAQFGSHFPTVAASTTAPEPAAASLLGLAVIAAVGRQHRVRSRP